MHERGAALVDLPSLYSDDVHFINPVVDQRGLAAFGEAWEKALRKYKVFLFHDIEVLGTDEHFTLTYSMTISFGFGPSFTTDGSLARNLVYDLRIEWQPAASPDEEPVANAVREVVSVGGRRPRPNDEPKCMDPKPVTPDPLRRAPERAHHGPRQHRRNDGDAERQREYRQRGLDAPAAPRQHDIAGLIGNPRRARCRECNQHQKQNYPEHRNPIA